VTDLAKDPRGIPVVVTRADSNLAEALARASHVQNHVPQGATWDGKSDLPMDDASYHEMLSDRASQDAPPPAPAAQPPPPKSGT